MPGQAEAFKKLQELYTQMVDSAKWHHAKARDPGTLPLIANYHRGADDVSTSVVYSLRAVLRAFGTGPEER